MKVGEGVEKEITKQLNNFQRVSQNSTRCTLCILGSVFLREQLDPTMLGLTIVCIVESYLNFVPLESYSNPIEV